MADTKEMVNVEVGETVIVTSGYGRRSYRSATVTNVARIWITMEGEDGWPVWKLRRDTQTDGSRYSSADRFYTADQWTAKSRHEEALNYLREQGIDLRNSSPWHGRERELAELLGLAAQKSS